MSAFGDLLQKNPAWRGVLIIRKGGLSMKLTIIYTGCGQVGIDTWANYYKTKVIELTEEQKEQIKPPEGMVITNVIFEISD